MDSNHKHKQIDARSASQTSWSLDKMVDKVRCALHSDVNHLRIRYKLIQNFFNGKGAPILTVVPIYARREAEVMIRKHGIRR